jgi:hypothetical protein
MDGQTDEFMPPLDGQMNGPLDSQMKDHICQTDDELIPFLDGMNNRIGQMDGIDDELMPTTASRSKSSTQTNASDLFPFSTKKLIRRISKDCWLCGAMPCDTAHVLARADLAVLTLQHT